MSEGLCASSWTGTAAHSLCARLLEEVTVCYLPQTRCACGVHVQQTSSWTSWASRRPSVQAGALMYQASISEPILGLRCQKLI